MGSSIWSTDSNNHALQVISKVLVFVAVLGLAAERTAAQIHSAEDRAYMSKMFDGVWFVSASSETIRIRIEKEGLSVLVDESVYFREATVTDINREENAITFEYNNQQFSLTRIAGTDLIKIGMDTDILRGERSRRLSSQDNETLNVWYNFKPDPCGNFNQFCEDQ
jgi:hypothetical protein